MDFFTGNYLVLSAMEDVISSLPRKGVVRETQSCFSAVQSPPITNFPKRF